MRSVGAGAMACSGVMRRDALEVAIVHHRTPTLLAQALERLAAVAPDVPVRVVDSAFDASLPRQLDGIHPLLQWTPVVNHSYAFAVNSAVRLARRPLLAQMNADVLIEQGTLPALAAAFEDPRVAAAGPLARTPSGRLQDQGLPYRAHHARLRWASRATGRAAAVTVPWLSGCLQVLRLEALRGVGGFDTRLRFYNEDLEWCLRARRGGWRCVLVDAEVLHVGGASTQRRTDLALEGLRGGYAVSARHAPAWLRPLHRWGLAGAAYAVSLRTSDVAERRRWRGLARRAAGDELATACFGPVLDEPLC